MILIISINIDSIINDIDNINQYWFNNQWYCDIIDEYHRWYHIIYHIILWYTMILCVIFCVDTQSCVWNHITTSSASQILCCRWWYHVWICDDAQILCCKCWDASGVTHIMHHMHVWLCVEDSISQIGCCNLEDCVWNIISNIILHINTK